MSDVRNVGTGSGGLGTALFTMYLELYGNSSTMAPIEIPFLQNQNSRFNIWNVTFSAGTTTIPVPTTAGGVVVILPKEHTEAVYWVVGVTTFRIKSNGVLVIPFADPPPSSILFSSASGIDDVRIYWL